MSTGDSGSFGYANPRTIDLQSWNWRGIDVINGGMRHAPLANADHRLVRIGRQPCSQWKENEQYSGSVQ